MTGFVSALYRRSLTCASIKRLERHCSQYNDPVENKQAEKCNSLSLLSHLWHPFSLVLNSRLFVLCVCTFLHLEVNKDKESVIENSSHNTSKLSRGALVANVLIPVSCAHAVALLPALQCCNYWWNAGGMVYSIAFLSEKKREIYKTRSAFKKIENFDLLWPEWLD